MKLQIFISNNTLQMRCTMNFKLLPMTEADLPAFKSDIQEAFQKGFEDVYG